MEKEITLDDIKNNNLLMFLYSLIQINKEKLEEQKILIDDLTTRINTLESKPA